MANSSNMDKKWRVTRRHFLRSAAKATAAASVTSAAAGWFAVPSLAQSVVRTVSPGTLRDSRRNGPGGTNAFRNEPADTHAPRNEPGDTHASRNLLARIGIVTDSHYADIDQAINRYYRDSLAKMRECVELMNDKQVDFMIELGDLMNGAEENNREHLRRIERVYAGFNGPRYHVLGNHDMDGLSKEEFQTVVENTGIPAHSTYYSFDRKGLHVVVLDANYTQDGADYDSGNFHWTDTNIPEDQLKWLEKDLSDTNLPALICVHQLLDHDEGNHYIKNAAAVRRTLEAHPNVLAVFHGHQHGGQYSEINGIHYFTFRAMVEGPGMNNSSYSIAEIYDDQSLVITGYRRAISREFF